MAQALDDAEIAFGAAWTFNPDRWGTHDGYVDYHTLLRMVPALVRARAAERLSLASAVRMGMGGPDADRLMKADQETVRRGG